MTTVFRMTKLPPSTNNLFINVTKGRVKSQQYETWLQEAQIDYYRQRPKGVAGPVHITMEFQEPGRKSDLDNRVKAPLDFCVKSGIIEADDNTIVRSISAKWSDEVEGVRVTVASIFASPETKSATEATWTTGKA
jgi:Holliday junction resolvase RusA-like endonuclease